MQALAAAGRFWLPLTFLGGLEKAANCPGFNSSRPFCKLGASEFSAFLFLPRLPVPHSFSLLLSKCNPWQEKVTSSLQHPPPTPLLLPSPSSTAYDIMSGCCGQPDGLDVTVKCSELPQNPSFFFPACFSSSFLAKTHPWFFSLHDCGPTARELLRPAFLCGGKMLFLSLGWWRSRR